MKIDQLIKFQSINEKLTQVTLSHEFSGTIVELGAQVGAELADFPLALHWSQQMKIRAKITWQQKLRNKILHASTFPIIKWSSCILIISLQWKQWWPGREEVQGGGQGRRGPEQVGTLTFNIKQTHEQKIFDNLLKNDITQISPSLPFLCYLNSSHSWLLILFCMLPSGLVISANSVSAVKFTFAK